MNANRSVVPFSFRVACAVLLLGLTLLANGQSPPLGKTGSVTPLIEQMIGTWKVQQRMWTGPDAKPVPLPQAVARRRLVSNAFLEETMELAGKSEDAHFTRTAYFSYNPVNQQYEYFSIDSRAPQMMSYAIPGANKASGGKVELRGGTFVASEWGDSKNVPFTYRISIGSVKNNQQVVQLFLTQQSTSGKEFLAFEYVYNREP